MIRLFGQFISKQMNHFENELFFTKRYDLIKLNPNLVMIYYFYCRFRLVHDEIL